MTSAPERTIVNPAKEILKSGGPLFGFNVFESLRPSIVKIAAAAGYKVVMENGRLGIPSTSNRT